MEKFVKACQFSRSRYPGTWDASKSNRRALVSYWIDGISRQGFWPEFKSLDDGMSNSPVLI